jgi:alkaline phosphatase D
MPPYPRLALLASLSLLAGCGGGGGGDEAPFVPDVPHVVAAGDVDTGSVVLWARSDLVGPVGTAVTFEVATDPGFTAIVATRPASVLDTTLPMKVTVDALQPGTTYHYRVTTPTNTTLTPGTFKTAALLGTLAGLRFGIGGDWRQDMLPYPALRNAPSANLDFFVALGDVIYADYPSPDVPADQAETLAEFRAKHTEAIDGRGGLNTLGDLRDSTVFFSTIDDHEVIDDFAGGAHPSTDPRFVVTTEEYVNDAPLFETGLQAFEEYHPTGDEVYVGTGDPRTEAERKLYRFRTFGSDAAIFVLDTRSFRDEMIDNPDPIDSTSVAAFREASFDPTRTFLGEAQLEDLKADLLAAETAGVTWKFVCIPEPIQNLGPANPNDRYEGYAYERSRLLEHIATNGIANVVFLTADIHGTVVNNLQYQLDSSDDPQIDVDSFEISTPAVAYDPPLGTDTINSITLTPLEREAYDAMSMDDQDAFFRNLLDTVLEDEGFDPTGLEGSSIDATLEEGSYVRAHAFGWVELQIAPVTGVLTVSVWGIESYEPDDADDAAERVPFLLTRFTVNPKPL